MGVDWEERVNFDRLRTERLARISRLLKESELGALLCFDMNNIRYITNTTIGTWAIDKLTRFCLLPQDDEPINWDFGVAAKHHQMYCPWLGDGRSRAGISTLRGAMPPASQRPEDVARKIRIELEERGLHKEPLGVDVIEPPVMFALQKAGLNVVDGQQLMQDARVIKTRDEITLLSTACSMVDAAYEELYRFMRPGVRENQCVGLVNKVLYDLGSEHVEGVNAISGERCSPHPHIFSDRTLRPGDLAFYDILHSYNGYRTCYYRTLAVGSASAAQIDAYKRCRYYLDAAVNAIRPGVTTADVAKLWPKAQEFGVPNEEAAFALQFGHGVGLSIWEKPVFSRLVSFDAPEVIEENMVFALETYWPASDGWSAARIEEQLVVTKDGCEVITRFPAEELVVTGIKYHTVTGPLPGTRETQSHKNIDYTGVDYGGAGLPDEPLRAPRAANGRSAARNGGAGGRGNHRKTAAARKTKKARER
jgi:Xaa-Pro aminopeptidase